MRSRRMPALFTRMSRPPNVSTACSIIFSASDQFDTDAPLTTAPTSARVDLVDHLLRRCDVGARATHVAAEVVHDDRRALVREQERVGATDAAPRAGDDRDLAVEATHCDSFPEDLAWGRIRSERFGGQQLGACHAQVSAGTPARRRASAISESCKVSSCCSVNHSARSVVPDTSWTSSPPVTEIR